MMHPNPIRAHAGPRQGFGSYGLMGQPLGAEFGLSNKTLRPRVFPRGLGAGTVTGEKIGGSILGSAGIVAAINPIAGAVVAAVGALTELVTSFVGGGCGSACVNSAEAEQIYEVAGDDLAYVARLGMLTDDEYSTGMQNIISGGTQHMQQLALTDPSATKGLQNMLKSLPASSLSGFNPPIVNPGSVPLDMSAAQAAFKQPGASGWYAGSVSAGNQLAAAYLNALAQLQTSGVNTGNVAQALSTPATASPAGSAPIALAPGTSSQAGTVTQTVTTANGIQVPVTAAIGSTATTASTIPWTEIGILAVIGLGLYFVLGRD